MGLINSLFEQRKSSSKKANCKTNIPNEKDLSMVLEHPEEFSSDILPELQNDDIVNCSYNGVQFHNIPNMIKLTYSGILAKNNSQEIYAVIGYGDNDKWEDAGHYLMHRTNPSSFELLTFRKKAGSVNIAFKDSADNWDNNSGRNYVFYDTPSQGSH